MESKDKDTVGYDVADELDFGLEQSNDVLLNPANPEGPEVGATTTVSKPLIQTFMPVEKPDFGLNFQVCSDLSSRI